MLRRPERLDQIDRRHEREVYHGLTFEEALERFAALWVHARRLRPDLGSDWRDDLDSDIAIARAVNGLPPRD
jgi:hypothetical protein